MPEELQCKLTFWYSEDAASELSPRAEILYDINHLLAVNFFSSSLSQYGSTACLNTLVNILTNFSINTLLKLSGTLSKRVKKKTKIQGLGI